MTIKFMLEKKKWCWIASQTKSGWRLKLAIGENKKDDIRLEGLLLSSEEEVKKIVKGSIVFFQCTKKIIKKTIINN